jgi:hypothetical protein
MRGRNAFERAPVRLNVGAEKEVEQERRQGSGHPTGINGNDVNRAQMANFGHNGGIREQPRRKGDQITVTCFNNKNPCIHSTHQSEYLPVDDQTWLLIQPV